MKFKEGCICVCGGVVASHLKVFRIPNFVFLQETMCRYHYQPWFFEYCPSCYLIYSVKYGCLTEIEFIVLVVWRHLRVLKFMSKCMGERILLAYLGSVSVSLSSVGTGWHRTFANRSLTFWIRDSLKEFSKTGQTSPSFPSRIVSLEETQSTQKLTPTPQAQWITHCSFSNKENLFSHPKRYMLF